jgi:hypothetical protein
MPFSRYLYDARPDVRKDSRQGMEAGMFWLIRRLPGLLFFLIGLGLCLGWFCLSKPNVDPATNKVNFSVTVDTNKLEADAEKFRQGITEQVTAKAKEKATQEVTQRIDEFGRREKPQGAR